MNDLKKIRARHNLTQSKIAKITGYTREHINKLEKSGKQLPPPMYKLLRMYTCHQNIISRFGNWRCDADMIIFTNKVLSILTEV